MTTTHDMLSTVMGDAVRELVSSDPAWRQVFGGSLKRVGSWEWPRPDYIVEDAKKKSLMAIEFKPQGWEKREYVTGFGQAMAYLNHFEYSTLIVPQQSVDGFQISRFLSELLSTEPLAALPVSLVSYAGRSKNLNDMQRSLKLEVPLTPNRQRKKQLKKRAGVRQTFWAFWRDTSNYEVLDLLRLSDSYSSRRSGGDIYSDHVWPKFYKNMMSGKTKTWEGQPRKLGQKGGTSHLADYKKNYKISLFHLGLWEQSDGRLTREGYRLLNVGRIYGPDSSLFIDFLSQLLLTEGKHLDLINQIQEFQNSYPKRIGDRSDAFRVRLEQYFDSKGVLKRNPMRKTTAAKGAFIRDEPKVWNKLGLLRQTGTQYFVPKRGYIFDWQRITDILREDFSAYG